MTPKTAEFYIEKRRNVHAPKGQEWALNVSFDNASPWTLRTWHDTPDESDIDDAIRLVTRAFEVYHRHLHVPRFDLSTKRT
jgi:hypothetical protein